MLDIFKESPWLIVVALAFLVPILGVVFGTLTTYWTRVRLAELKAGLKQDMLQRGMSADDIKLVIEATPLRKGKKCQHEPALR